MPADIPPETPVRTAGREEADRQCSASGAGQGRLPRGHQVVAEDRRGRAEGHGIGADGSGPCQIGEGPRNSHFQIVQLSVVMPQTNRTVGS